MSTSKIYMVYRAGAMEQAAKPIDVSPSQPWEMGGSTRYETRGSAYMTYKLVTAVRADSPEAAVQMVASMTQTLGTYVAVEGHPVSIDLTATPVKQLEEDNGGGKNAALEQRIAELEKELNIGGMDAEVVE